MQLQRKDFTAKPTPESYDQMIEEVIAFVAKEGIDLMDMRLVTAMLNASFEVRVTLLWPKPSAPKS